MLKKTFMLLHMLNKTSVLLVVSFAFLIVSSSCRNERGYPGPVGQKGDQGDPGVTVIVNQSTAEGNQTGSVGPTGPRGSQGTDGQDGRPGTDGQDGSEGTNGTNGSDGQPGTNGNNGQDGNDALGVVKGWSCAFNYKHCYTVYEALFHEDGPITVNLKTKQSSGRLTSSGSIFYFKTNPDIDVTPVVNDFYYAERVHDKAEVIFTERRTGYQFVMPCHETNYQASSEESEKSSEVDTEQVEDDMLDSE